MQKDLEKRKIPLSYEVHQLGGGGGYGKKNII